MQARSPKTRVLSSIQIDELARVPLSLGKAADEAMLTKTVVTAAKLVSQVRPRDAS